MKQSDRLLKAAYGMTHKSPRKKKEHEIKSALPSSATPKRARDEEIHNRANSTHKYAGENSPIGKIQPYVLHIREDPSKQNSPSPAKRSARSDASREQSDAWINRSLFTSKDLEDDPEEEISSNAKPKNNPSENSRAEENSQRPNTQEKEILNEICQKSSVLQDFHPHRASHCNSFLQPYDVFHEEKTRISGRAMSVSLPGSDEFHAEDIPNWPAQSTERKSESTGFRHLGTRNLLAAPLGLRNSGNECHIITVLTAIRSVPAFYQWISQACEFDREKRIFSLLHEYFQLSLEEPAESSEKTEVYDPKDILACIRGLSAFFRSGAEEDAHEGFLTLTDILEAQAKGMALDKSWSSLHYWEFQVMLTCTGCGHESESHETMSCLAIRIPEDSDAAERSPPHPTVISTALNSFLTDSEHQQHSCPTCAHTVAVCRRRVAKYPQVMVLHVMRFRADKQSHEQSKVHAEVLATPVVGIKTDTKGELHYSFCAVISHLGEDVGSGHYICDFVHPCQRAEANPVSEQGNISRVLPVADTMAAACEVYTQNDADVVSGTQEQRSLVNTLALRSRTSYLFFYQLG